MAPIKEREDHVFGLLKGKPITLQPGEKRNVWVTDSKSFDERAIRELTVVDENTVIVHDCVGFERIPGGYFPYGGRFIWDDRRFTREAVKFNTTSGAAIFWEEK